jgi:hypothetical protein
MNDQTWIDNYRTPHSDKLHVIQRFHVVNSGKTLQVDVVLAIRHDLKAQDAKDTIFSYPTGASDISYMLGQ